MKKIMAVLVFLCIVVSGTFAQTKPRLAILPFAGGAGGDGETIATLFSFQSDIQGAFTVVPRTSAVNALVAEQKFQLSGYTDSDTIARLGRLLNADFVVSGHIRRLGDRNLIITTIINVETFEQLAGDYREYGTIEEVRVLLPAISNKMITASRRNTQTLPKLAVAPFNIAVQGANIQDGETLAQILTVEITNTGKFAVLPRTTTMQAALSELEYQISGYTAEEGAKALGRAINAEYVLSAELRSLGSLNMFTAQILNVEDGSLLAGASRDYRTISDGIVLMADLALLLTDKAGAQTIISARQRELSRAAFFADPARLWSVGVSVGSSVADPFVIGTVRGTVAPLRYSFLELGCDVGFISKVEGASYYSVYPFAHYALFLPFTQKGGWYIGAGGGCMIAEYQFDDLVVSRRIFAADLTAGVNIGNFLDISYTLRTDFASAGHKISLGYCYRFR
jgi:TolB-like protein